MNKAIIFTIILSALLASCKAAPPRTEEVMKQIDMPAQEQNDKALIKFKEMLDGTADIKREEAIPMLAEGYNSIINQYPQSFLAEESYYRLMTMKLRDYYPPREEEAEQIYREYFQKYKKPRIGMAMNGDLARYYHDNQRWEKLAKFTTPFMREFAKSGKYGDTVFLFLYSEAKFHTKDYDEARKGYQIIRKNFKGTRDAEIAEKRLNTIKSIMEQAK